MRRDKLLSGFAATVLAALGMTVSLAVPAMSADTDDKQPAKVEKADSAQPATPAAGQDAKPEPAKDRYAVPEGGVPELLAFVEGLQTFQPSDVNEYMEHRSKAPAALQAAAEKILQLEKDEKSAAYQKAKSVLLQDTVRRIGEMKPEEQQAAVDQVSARLAAAGKELTREDVNLAMSAARGLEYSGSRDAAAAAYESFNKVFAGIGEPQLADLGELFAGSARRLKLVGNELELSGTKLDGQKFNLAELKGKVVLVDFWATWCGPCRAEFPHVKEAYEKHHAQGFEVVGVSLDQDRKALEQYVQEQQVPWITLHEPELQGRNPAARHYGIMGIPTMFLVGRDGKVISTQARGAELKRLLAEQFPSEPPKEQTGE
jgi:thiol-disulfide isomerase/thioredoxin